MKRMRYLLFALAASAPLAKAAAQLENAHWVFYDGYGIDFRSSPPSALDGLQTFNNRGFATISDQEGELLFHADEYVVYNRNNMPMPGMMDVYSNLGIPYQSPMAIPWPGHPDNYFVLFHPRKGMPDMTPHLHYHLVDMAEEGGMGAVVVSNQMLADSVCAPLAAVPHATDHAWWIIMHHATQPAFLAYRLDTAGFHDPVLSYAGTLQTYPMHGNDLRGFLRPSLNGDKLFWSKYYSGFGINNRHLERFNFDAATGVVSNRLSFDEPAHFWGVEFSPSGQFAYVAERICNNGVASRLWQYDVSFDAPQQIMASKTLVHEAVEGNITCQNAQSGLATAIDGRIYVGAHVGAFVGVIEEPDLPFPDCSYVDQGLGNGLQPVVHNLPNQPRAFPKADNTSIAAHRTTGPSLQTWPNPASGQLFVQTTGLPPANSHLRLFAADGRQVRTARTTGWPHAMDLQGLAPGLYLLRVEGPQGSAVQRVVIE
jgi:hypothetical protein